MSPEFRQTVLFTIKLKELTETIVSNKKSNSPNNVDLCNHFCMSKATLFRKTKDRYNISPVRLMTKIRLNNSAKLLRMSDLPINEIALKVGFTDHQYFCRTFKKQFGTTPTNYRRNELIK